MTKPRHVFTLEVPRRNAFVPAPGDLPHWFREHASFSKWHSNRRQLGDRVDRGLHRRVDDMDQSLRFGGVEEIAHLADVVGEDEAHSRTVEIPGRVRRAR